MPKKIVKEIESVEGLSELNSNCTNRVIACSKNQMDAFPSMNWFDVVHHGINPEPFPYMETPDNYLCFLGRIDPTKQPHLAIQLAINLKKKIKVAGGIATDEARQYFVSEVKSLLDHPLVEFLGEINFEEKIQLLSHAQCNLHPTGFREPFGLTIIEAGFCGTPTLAIRRGALSEIIKDGETGVLVDDFVKEYYRFEESLRLSRQTISKYYREGYSDRVMASNYIKAYRKLLDHI